MSRGLGDVYKRQDEYDAMGAFSDTEEIDDEDQMDDEDEADEDAEGSPETIVTAGSAE